LKSLLEPSPQLLEARRELHFIPGFELLEDFSEDSQGKRWTLKCRLSIDTDSDAIPSTTDWVIVVDSAYPSGKIAVYPAAEGGIERTFPHQTYNAPLTDSWRSGKLCLSTDFQSLRRYTSDSEPLGASERLPWHVKRAIHWLELAARNELLRPGDPFELPEVPALSEPLQVAFNEGPETFGLWQGPAPQVGLVEQYILGDRSYAVRRFESLAGEVLYEPDWGLGIRQRDVMPVKSAWVRLPSLPILKPWHLPGTWGELREAVQQQGLNLDELLSRVAPQLRDGRPHLLLLGFPISQIVEDPDIQQHWFAVLIPELVRADKAPAGWRNNERSLWRFDVTRTLNRNCRLFWQETENWHEDQLSTRGRAHASLRSRPVAVLGVGALGSVVAESLVRVGVNRLLLVDADELKAGNLVRHNLSLNEVGQNKAKALSERLNTLSPHAKVEFLPESFPPAKDEDRQRLSEYAIILDFTAEDRTLIDLEGFSWEEPKLFLACSVGAGARRLFMFEAFAATFPEQRFHDLVDPWLLRDQEDNGAEFPREGIGCWHPVFPARFDDFSLWSGVITRRLETLAVETPAGPRLDVYEQIFDGQFPAGMQRVAREQ
jgi:hypothetical protein